MLIAVILLAFLCLAALVAAFVFFREWQQTRRSLQELLLEAEEAQKSQVEHTNGDVYLKIDEQFNISFIEESGAKTLGYTAAELTEKPIIGTLLEDVKANNDALNEMFGKSAKKQTTFNTQMLIRRKDGKNMLMLVRIRPILNEILKCKGLSLLCKDISKADSLQRELKDFQSIDPFTNILNETTLKSRFEHDFKLANRYNKELSAIIVELCDLYDFIAKGIDFETADNMLKKVSNICIASLPKDSYAGRVDKTKIVLALKNTSRKTAQELSEKIYKESVETIKKLRVDGTNAQMIIISYSDRKGFTDSFDAMYGRMLHHINMSLKNREYGLVSSKQKARSLADLENIKG